MWQYAWRRGFVDIYAERGGEHLYAEAGGVRPCDVIDVVLDGIRPGPGSTAG
jgi:hypothetical protein